MGLASFGESRLAVAKPNPSQKGTTASDTCSIRQTGVGFIFSQIT
jgi:hypothetical protein